MNSPDDRPVSHIVPARRLPRLGVREFWSYRDLLVVLAGRDIKLRYRQTALGIIWVIIGPLLSAGIFSFVFSGIANLPSDGVPYFSFAFAGAIAMGVFSGTVGHVTGALTGNTQLVSKIYFHRLVLPVATLAATAVDLVVGIVTLLGVALVQGVGLSPRMFALPLPVFLLAALGLAVGLVSGAAAVRYRDIGVVTTLFVQLMFYISPVAYSSSVVPHNVRPLYNINPVVGMIDGFRWVSLAEGKFPLGELVYSSAFTALALLIGLYAFKSLERMFSDVI